MRKKVKISGDKLFVKKIMLYLNEIYFSVSFLLLRQWCISIVVLSPNIIFHFSAVVVVNFKDPEVAAAFQDISSNPANISKYHNNPKVQNLMKKMMGKFSSGGPGDGDEDDGNEPPNVGSGGFPSSSQHETPDASAASGPTPPKMPPQPDID